MPKRAPAQVPCPHCRGTGKADAPGNVGARIRHLRIRNGMEPRQLAKAAGIDPSHMSRIENGHVDPGVHVAYALAKALGVELSELVKGLERPKKGSA